MFRDLGATRSVAACLNRHTSNRLQSGLRLRAAELGNYRRGLSTSSGGGGPKLYVNGLLAAAALGAAAVSHYRPELFGLASEEANGSSGGPTEPKSKTL
jgi:hypothetical protein